ncbi:MAG: glycine--tRNA ligase [archaeon]|jgi:glycyl-tRNA synthetase
MKKQEKEGSNKMEKIVSLCKRRGFIFPGSEIYGGLSNSYDYGPLGTELFYNINKLWWKKFVHLRDDVVGVRGPIIMNPKIWEASGHIKNFTDPLVECKICHTRIRSDKPQDIENHEKSHKQKVEWTEPKNFNLMFKTFIGTTEDSTSTAYLRGETAQTMFTDFKLIADSTRKKLPLGIAQVGKAFRNEITTGNFIFRMKEFTIAEFEYFVKPGEDEKMFSEILDYQKEFFENEMGIKKANIKNVELPKDELAHYSKKTIDIYYNFPFGWDEISGIANRTDYDLKNHINLSGQNLSYREEETKEDFVPYVIEPTFGLDRIMLAVLCDAYSEEDDRVVLKLKPSLAPYKVAVIPLKKNNPEIVKKAREIYEDLKKEFYVSFDDRGNIGKCYYSQDEIGTPFCITVDFDSLENNDVTVRDRDTMKQERVKIDELKDLLKEKLNV